MNTESPFPPKEELEMLKKIRNHAPTDHVRDNLTKKIEELKKKIAENEEPRTEDELHVRG